MGRETPIPPSTEFLQRERVGETRRGRLLVVDDFRFDRNHLVQGLADRSYEVVEAVDGYDGLEKFRSGGFDLVLLDSHMPGADGMEVLAAIREKVSPLDLPVIMVTGNEQTEAIIEALRLGANDYVTKPVDLDVIAARVETHLNILRLRSALQQEREFSENLIESAFEIILAADMERRLTLVNSAAEKAFGFHRTELLGKPIDVLFGDPLEGARLHNFALRDGSFLGEARTRRRDGSMFAAHFSASALRDRTGQPIGMMGIAIDLTELRRLEQEREQLMKAREEFLAMASHDLNNPLASILGFTLLLEAQATPGTPMSDRGYQALQSIRHSVVRMQKIINDFIDFQSLEEKRLWLNRVPTDLTALVEEVLEHNGEYARQKGLRLRLEAEPNLGGVSVDADRIDRVLRNLVGNAIKFCHPGCEVVVALRRLGTDVEIRVTDNGPGLSDEDMLKVFQKFERLSNQPTGGEKSSGLGLAICKQLVELHGGQIGVRNNDCAGATFWFTLPTA